MSLPHCSLTLFFFPFPSLLPLSPPSPSPPPLAPPAPSQPHAGIVFECSLVTGVPADLRRKAAKLVAGRAALAARVDAYNEDASAAQGRSWHEEIGKRLLKLQVHRDTSKHD